MGKTAHTLYMYISTKSQIYKFLSVKINGIPFHAWFMTQEFWMCTQYRTALCNTIFLSTVLMPEFQIDEEDTAFIYNNV
jgi:hypothetical protein